MKPDKRHLSLVLSCLLIALGYCPAGAHKYPHASVHDTVAAIIQRLQRELSADELLALTGARVEAFLTAKEREILGGEHVRFNVNVPVIVTILRDTSLGNEPFWLNERGFQPTGFTPKLSNREFDTWEKAFAAGEIGLGVHSLTGRGTHYLALLRPQKAGDKVKVTDLHPGHLRTTPFVAGVEPFVDQELRVSTVPGTLEGQLLVQMDSDSDEDARLVNLFSKTTFPAADHPDHVVLTWSADPRTSQTIQWRSSTNLKHSVIRYLPSKEGVPLDWLNAHLKRAQTKRLSTPTLVNDPLIHRHTVSLRGLNPGTTYAYCVGDGSATGWTAPAEFTTAPASAAPFSFIYLGDAQNGLDRWGLLLRQAFAARPDAAFYLMAGDLVTRGNERWDWDSFFEHSKGGFSRRPLVPVIGNHECQGGEPKLYLDLFSLPRNGPKSVPAKRAYAFEYGNVQFIILDSNLAPAKQTAWLEKQLAATKSQWKFVSYHHPAYSSGGNRDNVELRNLWSPIFDKHHVDVVLQGHDHAYLRTYPMREQKRVASAAEGTIYVLSVSGTKYYDPRQNDYAEVGFAKLSTYQVLDIQVDGNRLVYRAHDIHGKVCDEFVIEKPEDHRTSQPPPGACPMSPR
jgi:hypothetical protein